MEHQLLLKNGIELCQYLILLENCTEGCLPNILWRMFEGCLPNSGYQIVWNENVVQGDAEMYMFVYICIHTHTHIFAIFEYIAIYMVLLLSCFSHVQLFVTPWIVACQAPLSMGFSQQEYWSRLPCPPPGHLPDPGIKPTSPVSPALQVDFLPAEPIGETQVCVCVYVCVCVCVCVYY